MKKTLFMLLLCVLLAAQSACAEAWDRDPHEHWRTDAAGARTDAAAHTLDEAGHCAVCMSDFWHSEDGSCDIYSMNEAGSIAAYSCYAADGRLLLDERYSYTYDAAGAVTEMTIASYNSETGRSMTVYNAQGDLTASQSLAEDGTILSEARYEYEYDQNGVKLGEKVYENERLAAESVYTIVTDDFGTWSYESMTTYYEEDGSRYIVEYDMGGNELRSGLYDAKGNPIGEVYEAEDETAGTDEEFWEDDTSLEPAEGGAYLIEG